MAGTGAVTAMAQGNSHSGYAPLLHNHTAMKLEGQGKIKAEERWMISGENADCLATLPEVSVGFLLPPSLKMLQML